jgi:hypothetical protein
MYVWIYFDILKVHIFWNSCNVFAIEVKRITKSMESIQILSIFNYEIKEIWNYIINFTRNFVNVGPSKEWEKNH